MSLVKPKTVILQGEPGTGKSRMACLTAVRKPVHVIDVDRKIGSAGWAAQAIADKELTYWELAEPVDEENLKARLYQLAAKPEGQRKQSIEPKGLTAFANYIAGIKSNAEAQAAGTWVLDSTTQLCEHVKSHIMYLVGRSKHTWDQWNAYLIFWRDTMSVLRDLSKECNKDLIITVHERVAGEVGDRTTGIRMETTTEGVQRTMVGTMDVKIIASIEGQFGTQMASYADEVYHTFVDDNDKDRPRWRVRVWPDGKRILRTSFAHIREAVQEPDFRKIWKV